MGKIVTFPSSNISPSDTIFYDMVGNFIPPEWQELISYEGKVLSKTARQILSLVVSRMTFEKDKEIAKNNTTSLNELQETYYFFEKMLGLSQRRIRQCFVELEKSGYIKVVLINMTQQYTKFRNILRIQLTKCFAPYPKKISGQPENYFGVTRNNFHPHNIIDNNKSISESRYEEASFKNNNFEKESTFDNASQDLRQDFTLEATNSGEESNNKENLVSKVVNTAKTWYGMKKAEEFHPLTEGDAKELRLMSGREYNLSFINKLLLKLAESKPNNRFSSKEKLLSYMAKALSNEKRSPFIANDENFSFEYNPKAPKIEQYLREIEYSNDTSPEAQLKRKIASVFEPSEAYELLQAYSFSEEIENEEFIFKLKYNILLSEHAKRILLNQIQAVYGAKRVKHLRVIYTNNAQAIKRKHEIAKEEKQEISLDCYIETALLGLDDIWRKAREYLIYYCGKAADIAWFSKLELVKKDETNNKVFLKAQTDFIGSRITSNYFIHLKSAFESVNYSCELVKV